MIGPHFVLGHLRAGRYGWYFAGPDGEVAFRSAAYRSKGDAADGIEFYRRESEDPAVRAAPVIETAGSIAAPRPPRQTGGR